MSAIALARELGCARSSLYYKPKKPADDLEDKARITAVMDEHSAYGSRRVALALEISRAKAQRLMQRFDLVPRIRRGFRHVKPDDLGRLETHIPNILKALCPVRPNVVWAGDFTYFFFRDRFWYLATVIDVFTREIVGWHIANHHTTTLVIEAFKDAARRTKIVPQWFHSDQGSEYVSGAYESLLAGYGTKPSQSQKSSPWQNGIQESFYSQFKLELGDAQRFVHVGELIEAIHQQITYYNTRRIHSAIKMPPVAFRSRHEQQTVTFKYYSLIQSSLLGDSV
ncbi:MAG: IS3 family transposase [Candidatus Eisenbacteria bacterium]|nr:IS3 family transposase [Candidatus Eisenbacteria bacterium]